MTEGTELERFEATLKPAVIEADFEGMAARLAEELKPIEGMDAEQVAAMELSVQRSMRAELNRGIKEVEDARKAVKRAYNEPLAAFEERVKELLEPMRGYEALLGDSIRRAESAARQARFDALAQVYEEFAPALVPVVPPERVIEQKWTNAGFGERKAADELLSKVSSIARDWDVLQKTQLCFPEEAEAEFFRSLSLQAALDLDARRAQEQAAIDAMRAEVYGEPECELEPEPMPVQAPEPLQPLPPLEFEPVKVFAVLVDATDSQMAALKAHIRALGVHGQVLELQARGWQEAKAAHFGK